MFGSASSGSEVAAGEIRCTRCDVYSHARAHCWAVVQLRLAPSPPQHTFFDVGLLPPGYHFTDYSLVLTSFVLASLPEQQWVITEPQQQKQQQQQQQQWTLDQQKRLLDTQKQRLEQQRQWLDQPRLQQLLEQQQRQQYEKQQQQQRQQQDPQQEFCNGVIPCAEEHGILHKKREIENVPEGTETREDSLVAEYNTRAAQMTQLPGAREEMTPPSERTTAMGNMFSDNLPAGIKEQEDMLGRSEGQPRMREKDCAPEGVHDQQEDLVYRKQTTRGCVPEGMHDKQEDLFHRNMNAHERDKVDADTRNPTETKR